MSFSGQGKFIVFCWVASIFSAVSISTAMVYIFPHGLNHFLMVLCSFDNSVLWIIW